MIEEENKKLKIENNDCIFEHRQFDSEKSLYCKKYYQIIEDKVAKGLLKLNQFEEKKKNFKQTLWEEECNYFKGNIIQEIKNLYKSKKIKGVDQVYFASDSTQHYFSDQLDFGWGCCYRNVFFF